MDTRDLITTVASQTKLRIVHQFQYKTSESHLVERGHAGAVDPVDIYLHAHPAQHPAHHLLVRLLHTLVEYNLVFNSLNKSGSNN